MDALVFTLLTGFYALTQGYPVAFNVLLVAGIGVYWLGMRVHSLKTVALVVVIGVVIGLGTVDVVSQRYGSAPQLFAHDGLIQSEEATFFILQGKNPYMEDYTATPMALWDFRGGDLSVNPALYHYPYMPLTFLLAVPIQALLAVRFDSRILYVGLFLLTLPLVDQLTQEPRKKLLLLMTVALNPLFVPFLVRQGRNDVLVLCFIVATVYLLWRERWSESAVTLALACATKQFAWFLVPFYFFYVGQRGIFKGSMAIFVVTFALIVLPFILWQPSAFYEDTIAFQSAMSANGYPIYGLGFSMWLLAFGVIPSESASFPFWILQGVLGLPLLFVLLRHQRTRNTLRQVMFGFTLWFLVVSFFGRAFNDNYVGFIIELALIGALMENPAERYTTYAA